MTEAVWKPVLATFVLVLCGVAGCGAGGACSLDGIASFAGEPISDGSIRLDPVNVPDARRAASRIKDGRFEIPLEDGLLTGVYRVTIYGTRPTGRQIRPRENLLGGSQSPIAETVQYIPDKYNRRTELTVELAPGLNTKEFNLE